MDEIQLLKLWRQINEAWSTAHNLHQETDDEKLKDTLTEVKESLSYLDSYLQQHINYKEASNDIESSSQSPTIQRAV